MSHASVTSFSPVNWRWRVSFLSKDAQTDAMSYNRGAAYRNDGAELRVLVAGKQNRRGGQAELGVRQNVAKMY